jgi:TPR repeat protein
MGSINMLERTKQYDDSTFEGRDEDTDTHSFTDRRPAPYQFARSIANVHSDDSMPIFLSNQLDESEQDPYGNSWEGDQTWTPERKRPTAASRLLKMGIYAAAAAAIVAGLFSIDATRAVIINARASFAGLPSTLLSTSQPDGASRSAAPVQANIGARPVSIAATPPTREEIAAALKSARQETARQEPTRQVQPEIRAPEPIAAPPAAPVARRMDPDELAALMRRARGLVETGDITSARLLLERAAEAQEAGAALLLAQTYDPAVLGTQDLRSITPDPATARRWYQKAAEFGSRDAQQRLAQMQN